MPAPCLVRPTEPASGAAIEPEVTAKPAVLVSVPVPMMLPLVSVTVPTESLNVARSSVAPFSTVTGPVEMALATP